MGEPFGDDLAGESRESIFVNLNPVVGVALDAFREFADMLKVGPRATGHAVKDYLERARDDGEVAVTALLAGMDSMFRTYEASFISVGSGLHAQVDAISAAWAEYGDTGRWTQPGRRSVSEALPEICVHTSAVADVLRHGEQISTEATASAISNVATLSSNLANAGHTVFGELIAQVLPVGELMDAIDTAAVDHARAFADLHKALAAGIRGLTDIVETSVNTFRHTGQWNAPAVTIGS